MMRLGFVLEKVNPVTAQVLEIFRSEGAAVEVLDPKHLALRLDTLRPESDLYVLKSTGTPMSISVAAALHSLGAPTLNPYPTVALLKNKIVALTFLSQRGIPIPATYLASAPVGLEPYLGCGPLIVKPYKGSRGRGVKVVRTSEELAAAAPPHEPLLAQRYHAGDGLDRKLSVVEGRVFGVKRIFPLRVYEDKLGQPFEPDAEMRNIAARIGEALKLDTFSFDVIESAGARWVVDIGAFGSFMGVPDAPRLLADWIRHTWRKVAK